MYGLHGRLGSERTRFDSSCPDKGFKPVFAGQRGLGTSWPSMVRVPTGRGAALLPPKLQVRVLLGQLCGGSSKAEQLPVEE